MYSEGVKVNTNYFSINLPLQVSQ